MEQQLEVAVPDGVEPGSTLLVRIADGDMEWVRLDEAATLRLRTHPRGEAPVDPRAQRPSSRDAHRRFRPHS